MWTPSAPSFKIGAWLCSTDRLIDHGDGALLTFADPSGHVWEVAQVLS